MKLETLIEQNRTNHYKMLVIVDNNKQHQKIIDALKEEGWSAYDVTENILQMEKEFVTEYLAIFPAAPNVGRTEQMLYPKLLAQYLQRGFAVRFSAREFYKLLKDNFYVVDGFWFTEEQLIRYEEWKKAQGLDTIKEIKTGQQIFVTDEKTALTWLYQFLDEPKTFSDIFTAYHKMDNYLEDEIPELKELLDNNFIFEDKRYRRPRTEKEQEAIEAQREKELERAFDKLLIEAQSSSKRLKNVRKEAPFLAHQDKGKKALICFDGMGFQEWFCLKEFLIKRGIVNFKESYIFALPASAFIKTLTYFGVVDNNGGGIL